jgi:hypothetical protein
MKAFGHAALKGLFLLAAWILVTAMPAVAAVDPTPVLTGPNGELDGVADAGYFAWSQNTRAHPRHYDAFVRPMGQPRQRVNEPGTAAYPYSIELGGAFGNVLTFSEVKRSWDAKLYDLDTHDISNPPGGLNTSKDERHITLSGDYILFQRDPSGAPLRGRVILYDFVTDTTSVLADAPRRGVIAAGRVNGDYATYDVCSRTCNVFRYQISTHTTMKIPNPGTAQAYGTPADDGSVYFVRVGSLSKCGSRQSIVRYSTGGAETVVSTFDGGRDVSGLYVFTNAGTPNVYFNRLTCRTGNVDILDSVFT